MKAFCAAAAAMALACGTFADPAPQTWHIPPSLPVIGERSVAKIMDEIAAAQPAPAALAGTSGRLSVLVFKREARMETWRGGKKISDYALAAPCKPGGPKLCEGDGLVPEGIYRFDVINTSAIHDIALQLSYPSDEDRAAAIEDGRCVDRDGPADLGGDVCVHGGTNTGSCIPLGGAIRGFFREAVLAGAADAEIIIAPYDMRSGRDPAAEKGCSFNWYRKRLDAMAARLKEFPRAE